MDVDLLRPGTVPISPDTVLWFEFLLHPSLLLEHLEKPYPDPSPIELINKFCNATFEPPKNEVKRIDVESGECILPSETSNEPQTKLSLKQLALKILSLKVMAFIKWDLDLLRTLPFKVQITLLQDLLFFTNEQALPLDLLGTPECSINSLSQQCLFALLLYHRWLLGTTMQRVTLNIPPKCNGSNNHMGLSEESYICTPDNIKKSVTFLNDAIVWDSIPNMLTYECFVMLTEGSKEIEHKWLLSKPISKKEFLTQIYFDLGIFFFYKENYDFAKTHLAKCSKLYKELNLEELVGFVSFDKDILDGYLTACGFQNEDDEMGLLQQLNNCIVNHYTGVLNVMQKDNLHKEIPISHRINLELDIQALSSGNFTVARDLLPKIQSLNMLRCILDKRPTFQYSIKTSKSVDMFIWAIASSWNAFSNEDKKRIKSYCLEMILSKEVPDLLDKITTNDVLSTMFVKSDLAFISKSETSAEDLTLKSYWDIDFSSRRKIKFEIKALEQHIISSYNSTELRHLLLKLGAKNMSNPIWKINPSWELPIPLQSVLTSLPKGFLQDFGYVTLAKARELMLAKDWESCMELLKILQNEVKGASSGNVISKLNRLISWEILLVQVTQLLDEWPCVQTDKQALADACQECLQTGEVVIPRTEVMEHCAVCLLNLGRWDFIASFDKRWNFFEITASLATTCQELVKYKGTKKFSKDLWDLILPNFMMLSSQAKRSNTPNILHHESPNNFKMMNSIITRLRDSTALTIIISLLTKMYNVLRDETSLELHVDYLMLWPAVISNANSYNMKSVCEVLSQTVTQSLFYYPNNINWLRLMGDINFASAHYEASLNFYLKSLLVSSDYFSIPVQYDDHIFRKMIKSCCALSCYTQAAILCQFLEEVDYVYAFRMLAEQKTCNDAVDAYYHCFWDINILEYLVHVHHKRGEFKRRKRAIQVMSLLELNSNNNEEIQHEAINLRKSTFLRALCKQYIN